MPFGFDLVDYLTQMRQLEGDIEGSFSQSDLDAGLCGLIDKITVYGLMGVRRISTSSLFFNNDVQSMATIKINVTLLHSLNILYLTYRILAITINHAYFRNLFIFFCLSNFIFHSKYSFEENKK
ncbi:hypothetical protein [Sodalis ligni]|uniref:hypothetical protein n=1 Tax=Sodalis ligni TaxID=2697027 RepID=UPI0010465236|nr:hypothetical protein [Sodalis ligni]